MFVVVVRGKTSKSRLLRRWRKNKFTAQRREICGAPYFWVETATEFVPWDKIRALAGKNVQFLLEKELDPPPDLPIFTGAKLTEKLLEREFLKQLRRMHPAKLTVVDYDGEQAEKVAGYFRYAEQIRMITGRVEQYTDRAMDLLRQTGASLLISRDIRAAADSDMLFAPKGVRERFLAPTDMQVFTLFPGEIRGGRICYPKSVTCNPELEKELPAGISSFRFLSALYELSGFQQLEQIKLDIGLYI